MPINIIMIEVDTFPLLDLPPGRPFFKKGEIFSHFYLLEEGKAVVSISQIAIEVSAPIFLGDYEMSNDIEYRIHSIKSTTKCKIRLLPIQLYPQVSQHHCTILSAFDKFRLRAKVLRYWLTKLFVTAQHKRNDQVKCDQAIGIVLSGQFRLNSNIPIVRMKEPNFELRRRFQICAIGEHQLFEENLVCETHIGLTGIMQQKYASQLAANFEEFNAILTVASSKRKMHDSLSKEIAKNCRKKRNLFQHMVPITLKDSIKQEAATDRSEGVSEPKKNELNSSGTSEEIFTVKDNISQFLHSQWRRGLSLKLPRKSREKLKLQAISKKKVEEFSNPEMVSLSIPRQFKEVKFNFKMLLRTKDNPFMRSRRLKTQPIEATHPKLLFRD